MSFNKINAQKPSLVLINSNASLPANQPQNAASTYISNSQIIKPENTKSSPEVRIDHYLPSEVVGKRAAVMQVPRNSQSLMLDGLKQNLKTLNDLQGRLRFLVTELEEIAQKS